MPHLTVNDTNLYYQDLGAGDPALLFVHGTGDDHEVFVHQAEHFRARHRTIAVDLRGHGRSEAPKQEYTFPLFAEDLAAVIEHLALTRPVIVGHSMGGSIALELAARHPRILRALVLLDAPVLMSVQALQAQRPVLAVLNDPTAYRTALREIVETSFAEADRPEHRTMILDKNLTVPPHVMVSVVRNGLDYLEFQAQKAAAACDAPILYVAAGPGPPGTGTPPQPGLSGHVDLATLQDLCPDLMVGQTVGSGHRHHLEVPGQINAMIDRFVTALER